MLKCSKYIPFIFLCFCWGGAGIGAPPSEGALIGGLKTEEEADQPDAAPVVASNGTVIHLQGEPFSDKETDGQMNRFKMNESIGTIVGTNSGPPYAALVAPNEAPNLLANEISQKKGEISSVSFGKLKRMHQENDKEIFQNVHDAIHPDTLGIGGAFADSLFALSKVALGSHLNGAGSDPAPDLAADCGEAFEPTCTQKAQNFTVWASPLTFYAKDKGDNTLPGFKNQGLGGILGLDYSGLHGQIFGLGLAYTYQNGYGVKDQKKTKTHQELVTVYGSWKGRFLSIEGALWGGLCQMKNHRRTFTESFAKGLVFSPHIKISAPLGMQKFSMAPFIGFDWAYWRGSIKGTHPRPYSLGQSRSELGVDFVEKKSLTASILTFKQGISYVNKRPFAYTPMRLLRHAESNSTVPIPVSSKSRDHLAALSLSGSFALKNRALPVFSLGYEGEFGSKTHFHALALEFVKEF